MKRYSIILSVILACGGTSVLSDAGAPAATETPKQQEASLEALNGKWALTSQSCNGVALVVSGITETVEISNGKGTDTVVAGSCKAMRKNYDWKIVEGKYTPVYATGATVCEPAPSCSSTYRVVGNQTVEQPYRCPEDATGSGTFDSINVEGDVMTMVVKAGTNSCSYTYTKI